MNKKLIAIAIAGALAAPLAAQAEVTIYGKMHLSVDSINNDCSAAACGDNDSSMAVSSNSSRVGFKGAEDLGGGMKAIWQVESGVDLAGGGSTWNSRNSFVGLAGGFGAIIGGRHDTPYKTVGRKVDFFGDTVGDSRTLINQYGNDARTQNTLAYITPTMNGLNAVIAYVTDYRSTVSPVTEASLNTDLNGDGDTADSFSFADSADNSDYSAYSASVNYANGPLYVGLGLQKLNEPSNGAIATFDDMSATRLAASYKMGAIKVGALWQSVKNAAFQDGRDVNSWGLGASYTMGNNTIKAQYYNLGEFDDYNGVSGKNTGANKWAIGVDHAMSKQTSIYAMYAAVSNDKRSAVNVIGNDGHGDVGPTGGVTDADSSPSAFSVGLVHKF